MNVTIQKRVHSFSMFQSGSSTNMGYHAIYNLRKQQLIRLTVRSHLMYRVLHNHYVPSRTYCIIDIEEYYVPN